MKNKFVITALLFLVVSTMVLAPAQMVSAYLGDRTLSPGMNGYDVIQLQKNLNYLGYPVGKADGIYGGQTTQAVRNFQANNNMKVNGITNQETAYVIINQVSAPAVTTSAKAAPVVAVGQSARSLSSQDRYDLARVVHGEARGETFTGQVAIAAVVLNRIKSEHFGDTIREVIYEPGAFTAVADGQFYMEPDANAYEAVESAIKGWDPTGGAIYYWNPHTATNKWIWSRPIVIQIGKHVFAL